MDPLLIYAKTPIGDEAVRQSTRVVQRNLRMVLVQVDGKVSVAELSAKIGNSRLVEAALRELEEGGYIAPTIEAVSVWEASRKAVKNEPLSPVVSAMSEFSTFGPQSLGSGVTRTGQSAASNFSSFGKPILPTKNRMTTPDTVPERMSPQDREVEHHSERRRISPLRMVVFGGAAIVATLIGALLFYPYEQFKPGLESAVAQVINAPVRIGGVAMGILPGPHLVLTDIQIGSPSDGSIAEVKVSSPFSLLGRAPHRISKIDITGASLPAARLVAMPMFRGDPLGPGDIEIARLHVEQSRISMGEHVALGDIHGDIVFLADGKMEKAVFETVDRSLVVGVTPSSAGVALNIEGRAWKPAGSSLLFAALQAKGLLQKDKLLIQEIDTTFLGGILRGNWRLDWSNGLSMTGDGTLTRLDSRKVSEQFAPSLKMEGDLTGTVRLRSAGSDWEALWHNTEAILHAEITRGILYGVDLGEAARRSGGYEVRAGATKFDRVRSTISITPKQVVGREVSMDAGMVTANGHFVAERSGQVDGIMAVTMQSSVSTQRTAVRVFGVLPDLSAVANK